jgi:anti-sigma factor RsiW
MNGLRRRLECRFVCAALSAYLDGEARGDAARVERHLAQCAHCRAAAADLAAQARAIEALPAQEEPPPGFADRVMRRIAAAAPAQTRTAPAAGVRRRPAVVALAAAAAAVVVALALWAVMSRPQPRAPRPAVGAPQVAQKVPPPREVAVKSGEAKRQPAPAPGLRLAARPPKERASARPPASIEKAALAQEHREAGRSYEEQGQFDQALQEYAAARDEAESQLARLDVARVYEKTGHTAEALDELVQVAFAELDENQWEPLTMQ